MAKIDTVFEQSQEVGFEEPIVAAETEPAAPNKCGGIGIFFRSNSFSDGGPGNVKTGGGHKYPNTGDCRTLESEVLPC